MQTAKTNRAILKTVAAYKAKLLNLNETTFVATPPIGGWSYSEVYTHIFDVNLMCLMAIKNCLNGKAENKPTPFRAKVLLFLGSFPPWARYKVPAKLISRVTKIDLAAGLALITKFETQLAEIYPLIAKANNPLVTALKTKHPRLGYLNTAQWLRFIAIHLNHHLKQCHRIDKSLCNKA